MIDAMHREDIKADIRKSFGSVARFERLNGLPAKSVTDFFRGRSSRRVKAAVEQAVSSCLKRENNAPLLETANYTNYPAHCTADKPL